MPNDPENRVARMSPGAVDAAQIYNGPVHYFDRNTDTHIEIPDAVMVEVGKWTSDEITPDDYDCSYYAALLLGYERFIHWLPVGDEVEGRKLLIAGVANEKGEYASFTHEEAQIIVARINQVLEAARIAKGKAKEE
jgi:hypothetical protein